MHKKHNYPTQYELIEVFSSLADRSFINEFAQERGVFIVNAKKGQVAEELSVLFYEENDIEEIRNEAYNRSSTHTLNGFVINHPSKNFNLRNAYESIRENGLAGTGYTLDKLVKISSDDGNEQNVYKGSIEYVKNKVGRIEFLQNESNSFDFFLKQQADGIWQVEVDCNKSTDAKAFRKLLEDNLGKDVGFETIEQDDINTANAIKFFDRLAKDGMGENWLCMDVKHVTIRKGKEESLKEVSNADSNDNGTEIADVVEVEEEELIEIRQAILQGRNLRENSVVKQFESSGYRFTAMTYEFESTDTAMIIQIRAEFKGKPKVFEVGIKSCEEKTGLGSVRKTITLSEKENRKFRSQFWNNAKAIFDDL